MTTQIYLLRHGPAALRSAWAGNDADRPLTKDGRRKVKRIGQALAEEGLEPDLVITSPFARSLETATIIAKKLGRQDQTTGDETLAPGFAVTAFTDLLDRHPDAATIMIVGHEPDLSALTDELGVARIVLKKGGLVELEMDRRDPAATVLIRLEQPAHLLR